MDYIQNRKKFKRKLIDFFFRREIKLMRLYGKKLMKLTEIN